jgi:hypothetical protein
MVETLTLPVGLKTVAMVGDTCSEKALVSQRAL